VSLTKTRYLAQGVIVGCTDVAVSPYLDIASLWL